MWWLYIILAVVGVLLYKDNNYEWILIVTKTIGRDFILARAYFTLNISMWWWSIRHKTVSSIFSKIAKRRPYQVGLYFENDVWTLAQMEDYANRVARYFRNKGLRKGDTVALFMENNPENVCLWLGLSKLGVITALINTNLVSGPLIHSISSVKCKGIIFGSNLSNAIKGISEDIKGINLYQFHEKSSDSKDLLESATDLRKEINEVSEDPVILSSDEKPTERDALLYIYTSGTTGLPKAALITNTRYQMMACMMNLTTGMSSRDNVYNPLPLYHASGVILGIGQTLMCGVTSTIRKKFSASNYFKDCQKYRCTVAQYIGEMCRYILAAQNVDAKKHPVRCILGNGMKPQTWKKFVETFNIQRVCEFYGATEGNSNFINVDNKFGSVGAVPVYAAPFYPITLIECDQSTGEPIRNAEGRCTACKPDEPGLLVGQINQKKALQAFKGYSDKKATEKKILHDVFAPGDIYFNSGDILVMDKYGYIFFKDRTGDTFRWKGENVSTAEVEGVLSNILKTDTAVYGVEVPHAEGKAGMAAIVDPNKTVDLDALSGSLNANLPSYAIPLFLRVMDSIPVTGTYKVQKFNIQPQGFDINQISDPVYLYSSKTKKYSQLTPESYQQILDGKINL